MMMISDLPIHLVEEILSRVPLKYMRPMRLTCKKWYTLSKSGSFSKLHIDKLKSVREGESTMIVMMDYNLYLMSVLLVDNGASIEHKGKLTCLNEQVKISQVFHCDGLLLCVLKEDDTKVIVWNPYWGQTRSIESRYSHRPLGWDRFSYALGYEDKSSCHRSYKFLRFIDKYYNKPKDQFSWYEIYDVESGLWKTLDVTPNWRILFGQRGVSLKGNTYWPASERNTEDELDNHIICFDFTSQTFGPLLRLPFDACTYDDYVTLSCVKDEKLAVLLTHDEGYEIDIWVTTKIEAENVSWSKFLTVDTKPNYVLTPESFFIDEEKKVVMGFEEDQSKTFNIIGEAGYLRELSLGERRDINCRAHACSYVPSLVQIKQSTAGFKRNQQSDFEKQRYDQNILTLVAIEKRNKY